MLSAVSEVPSTPAGGQLGGGCRSEGARLGQRDAGFRPRGRAPHVLLGWDAAVAPALQDHLREGRALERPGVGRRLGRGSPGGA